MPDEDRAPRERAGRPSSRDRWRAAGIVCMVALLAAFAIRAQRDPASQVADASSGGSEGGGASSPGDWSTVDSVFAPEERPELVAAGQQTYGQFCVACHGPIPGGSQPLGPVLQAREYLAYASNRRIDSLIVHGVPGTAMAAWGRRRGGMLDDATVRGLVYYIRSLQPTAPSVPTWRNGRAAPPP